MFSPKVSTVFFAFSVPIYDLKERINQDFERSEGNGFLNLNSWNENKVYVLILFSPTSPGASAISCSHEEEVWVYVNPLSSGCRTALIIAAAATIYWSSAMNIPRNINWS